MAVEISYSGFAEVDGKLIEFERKILPAEARKGTRAAAKVVAEDYRANMADINDTEAMQDSIVVRALKRSRKRIGHTVQIDAKLLMELYCERHDRYPHPRKGESRPFYYPAIIELGGYHLEGRRPLREALYENTLTVLQACGNAVLAAINHTKMKESREAAVEKKIAAWRKEHGK